MTPGDLATFDAPELESWQWYVLVGYPVLSLFGVVALGQLTDGGSILASGMGSIALLILLTAIGVVSLPAIWRDSEFVRAETDEWDPDHRLYAGAAAGVPLFVGVLVGLGGGLGVAIALTVLTFLVSTVTACVAYLYNRHRAVGLTTR